MWVGHIVSFFSSFDSLSQRQIANGLENCKCSDVHGILFNNWSDSQVNKKNKINLEISTAATTQFELTRVGLFGLFGLNNDGVNATCDCFKL